MGVALLVGCQSRPQADACTPGSVERCQCADGRASTRICTNAGAFGACFCGGDAGQSADGQVAVDASRDVADAGPDGGLPPEAPAAPDATVDQTSGADGATDRPSVDADAGANDAAAAAEAGACSGCAAPPSLMLPARHLLVDSRRKVVYATVGGASVDNANALVVIDPTTRAIRRSVPIGSEPGNMAISDDGTTLWVGIDGAFSVRRVDLATDPPTPGAVHTLPLSDFRSSALAGPMYVLPGTTGSLAISLQLPSGSPNFTGVVILDDGVPRAARTPGHTGAARMVAGPPGWLFGFNNLHTGFGFYAVAIGATGVTQTEHQGLINGFSTDIVYADGRVYATSGEVVDVTTPGRPQRAGLFAFSGAVSPRPTGRALMVSARDVASTSTPTLRLLDTGRFTQIASWPLPTLTDESVRELAPVGDDQLVFLAGNRFGAASRIVFLSVGGIN